MPIYEYRCSSCGHEQEALQKLSEAPLTVCSACGQPKLVKLVSAGGFQLKGSGWYATDFKGSGAKPAPKSDSGESKSGDDKSQAKTETKSETKSESKSDANAQSGSSKPTATTGSGS